VILLVEHDKLTLASHKYRFSSEFTVAIRSSLLILYINSQTRTVNAYITTYLLNMDRKSRSSRTHEESSEEFSTWRQICSLLYKLEGIQKEQETIINSINKIQLTVDIEKGKICSAKFCK
jgi:hypothetical protein